MAPADLVHAPPTDSVHDGCLHVPLRGARTRGFAEGEKPNCDGGPAVFVVVQVKCLEGSLDKRNLMRVRDIVENSSIGGLVFEELAGESGARRGGDGEGYGETTTTGVGGEGRGGVAARGIAESERSEEGGEERGGWAGVD